MVEAKAELHAKPVLRSTVAEETGALVVSTSTTAVSIPTLQLRSVWRFVRCSAALLYQSAPLSMRRLRVGSMPSRLE